MPTRTVMTIRFNSGKVTVDWKKDFYGGGVVKIHAAVTLIA